MSAFEVSDLIVRAATANDAETIVDFNNRMARETEGRTLDPAVLFAGVRAALADPAKAIYFVAESGGQVIRSAHDHARMERLAEWGHLVGPERLRPPRTTAGGASSAGGLYAQARQEARSAGAVGIRLYVEQDNSVAQAGVRGGFGMGLSHYRVMEEMFT